MSSPEISADRPVLSMAVPMYCEEEGVDRFFARIEPILDDLNLAYEIVCVNDGSHDQTLAKLLIHRRRNPAVVVVDLSRNFGKEAAMTAALDYCSGDAIIPIDADLQDPPELIPRMVERWREGFEVVLARRANRDSDTRGKRMTAGWFYRIFNAVAEVPIPANVGDFRLMDRKVLAAMDRLGERNRFMKGLFSWVGFHATTVEFEREERSAGTTKWNYRKLFNFALDGIIAFSSAPLRFWSYLGALVSLFAFLYGSFLILRTLVYSVDVPGYASTMVVILFLGGIQLIGLGVIGEYLGRVYKEVKGRPIYLVRESHGITTPRSRLH